MSNRKRLTYLQSQRFGFSASLIISILIWLCTATVAHCFTVSDDTLGFRLLCKQNSLANYLIIYNRWPYEHTPFLGYWDSYDNKLASIIQEPYSQLVLTLAIAYLIWFRIVLSSRKRYRAEKKFEILDQ